MGPAGIPLESGGAWEILVGLVVRGGPQSVGHWANRLQHVALVHVFFSDMLMRHHHKQVRISVNFYAKRLKRTRCSRFIISACDVSKMQLRCLSSNR